MVCPKCKSKELEIRTNKKGQRILCCEEWKPKLISDSIKKSWKNFGECNFRIPFKNKIFGTLTLNGIEYLMLGKTIENSRGLTIKLDLDNEFFTKIDYPNKVEKFEIKKERYE